MDELPHVSVPNRDGRLHILRVHTAETPLGEEVDLANLADRTPGFTGADLEDIVSRAGHFALRENPNADIGHARLPRKCAARSPRFRHKGNGP